jgi:general secretion pathway protein D
VILEVNKEDLATLGAEYSTDPTAFGQIGVNGASALTTLTGRSSPDLTASGTVRPGKFNSLTTANISVLLDLLVTKANARILNQPTLWTRDNEEATFFKGRSVPFIVSTQTSSEGTATKDSVDYRGVGVTLRVRPNITPEKAVDMTVNLKVSQLDAQLVNGNIATSLLDTTTKTIVMDGQTIMIGGIVYQTDSETVNKVPLLGDIPILGALFSHVNSQKINSELIVFITPYVIDTDITAATTEMKSQVEALKKMDTSKSELRKSLGLDSNDVPLKR